MRTALVSIVLLVISASVVAQSVCPQSTSQVIEHKLGFTIHDITLPSLSGHPKTGQRRSGQNRPTGEAATNY
jgi:hypothetical protein